MYYYVSIELTNTYIIHTLKRMYVNRQHIMYHIYKLMVFCFSLANRYIRYTCGLL